MSEKKKVTPLSDLGEFGLIDHLTRNISLKNKSSLKGVGDDAAVLDYQGKKMVLTTDLLVEGIHFNLVYMPLKHLGYKAITVNLSDVYAMNAIPKQVVVSMAVSGKFSLEAMDELYGGIKLACENYGIDLVGGDTTSSVTGLTLNVAALGEVETGQVVYRNTARVNDLICVSGNLGAAYMGLQLLERERRLFEESSKSIQPDMSGYEYILGRQLKPEPRRDIIESLRENGIVPHAMIDLSDGLSSDLLHICRQSGLGCRIFQDKIPIDEETARAAEEMNIEPFICALNGGEDYELLFTIPLRLHDQVKKIRDVSMIGHITEADAGTKFITGQGSEIELQAQGWNSL
ncbi:MAG: thiamine-phosphate kinase [Bacteroidales bacterium]|nr:thiamine-phosphate kinase [Bacteroidales bacterium]